MTPFFPEWPQGHESFGHPNCYARSLENCSETLSNEHFLSYELLKRITSDPRGIFVKGFSWAPDGKWLQPESVAVPVLCSAHNLMLSPLDAFATELDNELTRIHASADVARQSRRLESVEVPGRVSTVTRFNGHSLERWLLKALCGMIASENARESRDRYFRDLPKLWLHFLFGRADWIPPCGLYIQGEVGRATAVSHQRFSLAPVSDSGRVVGIYSELGVMTFVLMLESWRGPATGAIDRHSIRRPAFIRWHQGNLEWRIDFVWDHSPGDGVSMEYTFA